MIADEIARISPVTLASRSPQRRAILTQLGIDFVVSEPRYEEHDPPGSTPAGLVVAHAVGKARSVEGAHVLGVDTTVAVDGMSLGKPASRGEARGMLRRLSGRTHVVHSGLCLRVGAAEHLRLCSTEVEFWALDVADLDWYIEAGEWEGRAGGYAVQGRGAALVRRIAGDYTNVVGLPVSALLEAMAEAQHAPGC
ncbi:MAG: nucleoside triphosphate pyrophosphatase [Gaiellales bacterium]|nr:nucleoside triphosphate pyrophosphatase [Gaiellales bacterium]